MGARLIVADDHEVVRQGLREIFAATPDLAVVGEAADGLEALRLAQTCAADLLLLDVALPRLRGLAVLTQLRGQGSALPVLFFSMYPAAQYADFARRAGAQGFIGKESDSATLLQAVRRVLAGERVFAEEAGAPLGEMVDPFVVLSPREMEVMSGLLQGATLDQIAARMRIGSKSVSTYCSRMLTKLGLTSNVELAALATKLGYL